MNSQLSELEQLIKELNKSNSTLEKKKVLKKHPGCKKLLYYTYNPFLLYGVKSANLKKNIDLTWDTPPKDAPKTLFDILEALNDREYTGHNAIKLLNYFLEANEQHRDTLYLILDRNLKTRVETKLINSVFPNLVPEFSVALAEDYAKRKSSVDFKQDDWYASQKLDGVRVLTLIDEGTMRFYSRAGKEFHTLSAIKLELEMLQPKNIVLDGEVVILDDEGREDFKSIVSQIKRKDYHISRDHVRYKIFDLINYGDFFKKVGNVTFSKRQESLRTTIKEDHVLQIVEQRLVKSDADVTEFMAHAMDSNWEGLILRKDEVYEGKRSKNMLKVKKYQDAEFIVKGIETGPFRIVENGKEVEIETMSAVQIEYKGNTVSVGSGFSIEDRKRFYKNPKEIVGKEITVQYFEETKNKEGLPSLRFPTVKAIWKEGKREV